MPSPGALLGGCVNLLLPGKVGQSVKKQIAAAAAATALAAGCASAQHPPASTGARADSNHACKTQLSAWRPAGERFEHTLLHEAGRPKLTCGPSSPKRKKFVPINDKICAPQALKAVEAISAHNDGGERPI